MAASEYGSYYWCVILNGPDAGEHGDRVHLHADAMSVDPAGTLTFTSAGRRPVGTEPTNQSQNGDEKPNNANEKQEKDKNKTNSMIYIAFAPGTWKSVYAAKLRDGSPVSVERWTKSDGSPKTAYATNEGAAGFTEE